MIHVADDAARLADQPRHGAEAIPQQKECLPQTILDQTIMDQPHHETNDDDQRQIEFDAIEGAGGHRETAPLTW